MFRPTSLAAAALMGMLATTAHAEDCMYEGEPWEATAAQANAVYDCMSAKMLTGYTKGDNATAAAYREWTVSATAPAAPGAHGDRFLLTFANDVAAETYLAFADDGVEMPVGGILAKESIKIGKTGKARVGPLFIMEKVGLDAAPDAGGWLYSGVQPNGKPLKIKQSFCHDCHVGWEHQDMMAYPVEEVRVSAN